MPRRSKLFIRLILVMVGLCFPLLMLEAGVRLVGLAPSATPNPAIWAPHPLFGWWHIPHSGGIFRSDFNEFEAEVRINARGLRDREIGYDNPDGALRILSLADSFGEALQVDLADTYHKQLETQLGETLERPVAVINGGVGGWGTDQEAIFYVAEGFRYEPDIVLLAFFIRNDAVNNYAPLEIERNGGSRQKLFFELAANGALIPPSLEAEAKAKAEAEVAYANPDLVSQDDNGPPLLGLADTLWRTSALYRLAMPHLRNIPAIVQTVGPSGLLGGEAVIRANHPTIPIPFLVYQTPPDERFEAAWSLTEAIILRLRDEVEKRDSRLAVVIIAAPEQLEPERLERIVGSGPAWDVAAPTRRLTDFLAAEGIAHLDLLPLFREAAAQADSPPLHFQHDQHWTVAGHQLAAESLHDFLLAEFGAEME